MSVTASKLRNTNTLTTTDIAHNTKFLTITKKEEVQILYDVVQYMYTYASAGALRTARAWYIGQCKK